MKFFDVYLLGKLSCLTLYFFIASQGGYYLLAFGRVLRELPTDSFLQIRKVTDSVIEKPLKILYPAALIALLVRILVEDGNILSLFPPLISFLLLLADLLLAIKVSIPLNKMICQSESGYPMEKSSALKQKWINFILIRSYLSITGFILIMLQILVSHQCQ